MGKSMIGAMDGLNVDMQDDINQIQELLAQAYEYERTKSKKRRMSDGYFARKLGISSTNLSHYLGGTRKPSYQTALQLSQHPAIGAKIFEVLGFDAPLIQKNMDPQLLLIVENWNLLPADAKQDVFNAVKEQLNGRASRHNGGDPG